MSTVRIEALGRGAAEIPLQPASLDIWDKKYRLKTKQGEAVDASIDHTYQRVAKALADAETTAEKQKYWFERFLWALRRGAIPAGRITSNAGALEHKPATSTINCTVSGTIEDSMDGILDKVHEAGLTLKAGLRHRLRILDPAPARRFRRRRRCLYVRADVVHGYLRQDVFHGQLRRRPAAARRWARSTWPIRTPRISSAPSARTARLRQFNLSLLITDGFMQAVENDADWPLLFPINQKEQDEVALDDPTQVIWREWPTHKNYVSRDDGLVACKIYGHIRAKHLWDMIMTSTYDYAEPGFILIDRVNEMNNNWWCENIRATNPCGEQPLPPYGSCLLGSVNLTTFVRDPFGPKARFDWDEYKEVVRVFTRMLDNVVEINGLPLEQQRGEITRKRRHGMGFLGLGSTVTMLKMKYGSAESCEFTEQIARDMAVAGWEMALSLAEEKGPAPIMTEEFDVTAAMLRQRPEMVADGYTIGDRIPGRILHARYSRYMQRMAEVAPQLVAQLAETGARFSHHSSIAPTGTISLSLANNASNGIEPSFAHHYSRNVIREGKKSKEKVEVFSYELLAYRELINADAMPFSATPEQKLPDYFVSADDISPKEHVDIQAAAPAVGGFVHLQDRQRAHRLPLRRLQGHLSLRP